MSRRSFTKEEIISFIEKVEATAYEKGRIEGEGWQMLERARQEGAQAERERIYGCLGFMRQWLNEDRITDPKKMVDTEQLKVWLNPSPKDV